MDTNMHEAILQELCSTLGLSPDVVNNGGSFPSLGGNSLSAVRLSKQCRKHGIVLAVDTIIRSKSVPEMIGSATPLKSLLCEEEPSHPPQDAEQAHDFHENNWSGQIQAAGVDFQIDLQRSWSPDSSSSFTDTDSSETQSGPSVSTPESSVVHDDEEDCGEPMLLVPASELQLSLLHGSIKTPGTNVIRHFETYRPRDVPAVRAAWRQLFEQEPALHTRYSADLLPQKGSSFCWTEETTEDETQFREWLDAPLGVTELGSSWKVVNLVQGGQAVKSVVVWTIHHALIDGYSAELLLTKLRWAAQGKPVHAGPSAAEVMGRLQRLRDESKADGDAFWTQQRDLQARAATALQLPPAPDTSDAQNAGFGECDMDVGLSSQVIAAIAQECGVTAATIYYAAWALLMTVLADNDTVAFGIALSGRNLPLAGIEEAIGPFVNTLPLAITTNEAMTLRQLAVTTFEGIHELSQYQWTTPDNGFVRNFQSALHMQFDLYLAEDATGVRPTERPYSRQTSDIPISVLIHQDARVTLQYQRASVQPSHAKLLSAMFCTAMQSFLHPDSAVGATQAGMVTPEMHRLVLGYGNCFSQLTKPVSIVDDLVTLFERATARNPRAVAVDKGGQALTYGQLNDQAGRVAAALVQHVKPGDVVCVDADRSVGWIVAIFGVLKAGAVYCPLDWELPPDLRELMFKKTGAAVFLSDGQQGKARAPSGCSLPLTIQSLTSVAPSEGQAAPFPRRACPRPAATAYVCFTSGSTGTPKGVVCSHEGLVAFQRDPEVRLFAKPGVRVSQVMSPAFDGSIHEIFSALCYGATIVLPAAGDHVFEALETAHSAILTPSVAEVLDPEDYPKLKHVYLVGEPVKQPVNDKWASAKGLYNMYGPTEGTCGATIKKLEPRQTVTIGRPNPTTSVYILSAKGQLMPPGVIGEIHLAGVQVSRGYLDMPEVTAERFLPDPISLDGGGRMYRTGDRGYWNANGDIVCLGRNDRQIKLRGFRLDLNDLEIRVAKAVPGLTSVAIAPRSDHLVAAVQPRSLDSEAVAAAIARTLPVYAQPRHIVLVDAFPMTRAGKLDYQEMVSDRFMQASLDKGELRTPLEARLAAIWRQVLKLDRTVHIGHRSSFLELGGNSLLQVTLLAKISSALKIKIPFKVTIDSTSLGDLAARLERLQQETRRPNLRRRQTLGPKALSAIERDWLVRYRLGRHTTTSAFNVSYVADLEPGVVDVVTMARAWDAVLARYSLFRSRYPEHGAVERLYADHPPRVQRVRHVDVWGEVNRPFDLAREPAVRVFISSETLAVVMSHIVADLTTLKILLGDVQTLYEGRSLEPVRYTYEKTVLWDEDAALCDLRFWSNYLEGHDMIRRRRTGYGGTSRLFRLSDDLASAMLGFEAISLQQLTMAAVALATQRGNGDLDVVVGTPFINRTNDADMETVGLFLEPLPVRVRHAPAPTDAEARPFLHEVRQSANAALGHAVPWHKLLEHLDLGPVHPDQPLFDVMVTFHHRDNAVRLEIAGVQQQLTWAEGAKFPLMAEFTASESGSVVLRIEYDDSLYKVHAIDTVVGRITTALSLLISNLPYTVIRQAIQDNGKLLPMATVVQDAFGVSLNDF